MYTVLYQTVLDRIQQLTAAVQDDDEFYALVRSKTEDNLPPDFIEKERYTLEKRMAELSGKVRKLFDEHASGVMDDGNYEMLMKDIQTEQKLSVLRSRLQNNQNAETQI